jgi:ribosomal protein S18 acetylase RimI-like enzyme
VPSWCRCSFPVAPAGLGLGDRLVTAHLRHAFAHPEITQVILSVVSTNEPALRLYRRHGFVEYGRLPAYFRFEGVDRAQLFLLRERAAAD